MAYILWIFSLFIGTPMGGFEGAIGAVLGITLATVVLSRTYSLEGVSVSGWIAICFYLGLRAIFCSIEFSVIDIIGALVGAFLLSAPLMCKEQLELNVAKKEREEINKIINSKPDYSEYDKAMEKLRHLRLAQAKEKEFWEQNKAPLSLVEKAELDVIEGDIDKYTNKNVRTVY